MSAINEQALRGRVDEWIAQGIAVAGPKRAGPGHVQYGWLDNGAQLLLDGFVHPKNSIKEFFFPRTEKLYSYRMNGTKLELVDVEPPARKQIILAARPCDAASLPVLDRIFAWDYRDEFWFQRRENSTVVTLACTASDEYCFCTTVGLGPGSEKGSDAMLYPTGGGEFALRAVTEKGAALFGIAGAAAEAEQSWTLAGMQAGFKLPEVDFNSPVFAAASLPCLGCGACAHTCPTCHCFDIVDEGTPRGGARFKNWDTCQFQMFTLHASGHNPRNDQGQRQRQRIYHKFRMYPEKFGEILCTGCGNCTRNCPAGLGVGTVLRAL